MQRGTIEQLDTAALQFEFSLYFQFLEQSADDFAGTAQFGSQRLVRGPDNPSGIAVLQQVPRKPAVQTAESDLLDQHDDARQVRCEGLEDKLAECPGILQYLVKDTGRQRQRGHGGLGDALSRVARLPEQAGRGEYAGISRPQPLEHDLATVQRARQHPDLALQYQQVLAALIPLTEHDGLRR